MIYCLVLLVLSFGFKQSATDAFEPYMPYYNYNFNQARGASPEDGLPSKSQLLNVIQNLIKTVHRLQESRERRGHEGVVRHANTLGSILKKLKIPPPDLSIERTILPYRTETPRIPVCDIYGCKESNGFDTKFNAGRLGLEKFLCKKLSERLDNQNLEAILEDLIKPMYSVKQYEDIREGINPDSAPIHFNFPNQIPRVKSRPILQYGPYIPIPFAFGPYSRPLPKQRKQYTIQHPTTKFPIAKSPTTEFLPTLPTLKVGALLPQLKLKTDLLKKLAEIHGSIDPSTQVTSSTSETYSSSTIRPDPTTVTAEVEATMAVPVNNLNNSLSIAQRVLPAETHSKNLSRSLITKDKHPHKNRASKLSTKKVITTTASPSVINVTKAPSEVTLNAERSNDAPDLSLFPQNSNETVVVINKEIEMDEEVEEFEENEVIEEAGEEEVVLGTDNDHKTPDMPSGGLEKGRPPNSPNKNKKALPLDATTKHHIALPLNVSNEHNKALPLNASKGHEKALPLNASKEHEKALPLNASKEHEKALPLNDSKEHEKALPLNASKEHEKALPLNASKEHEKALPLNASKEHEKALPLNASKEHEKALPLNTSKEHEKALPLNASKEHEKALPLNASQEHERALPLNASKEHERALPLNASKENEKALPLNASKEHEKALPLNASKEHEKALPLNDSKEHEKALPLNASKDHEKALPLNASKEHEKALPLNASKEHEKALPLNASKEHEKALPLNTSNEHEKELPSNVSPEAANALEGNKTKRALHDRNEQAVRRKREIAAGSENTEIYNRFLLRPIEDFMAEYRTKIKLNELDTQEQLAKLWSRGNLGINV